MGLDKTLISMVMNITKNISKFDLSIDSMQNKFSNGCPLKPELFNLIKSKNQISNILSQIQSQLNILTTTTVTIEKSNNVFNTIIKNIKVIPLPTSIPPGVGIPISTITNLSDILDNISDKLKQGKGILSSIPSISDIINNNINNINNKLNTLDNSILNCLKDEMIGLNNDEKTEFLSNLGISSQQDNNPKPELDSTKLPIFKDYTFIIEYDNTNQFPFPRRRIRAQKGKFVLLGEFSYSSSTEVLVNEMKFKINNL